MCKNYESTRNKNNSATSSEAVLNGLAPDGGLYVMRELGKNKINIKEIIGKNYKEIGFMVMNMLLDDFPKEKLGKCIDIAYTNKFDNSEIVPIVNIGNDYVAELFHGPTSAFKDVALSILPHLVTASQDMNNINKEVVILTATSGDTGKAALEGFKNVNGTKIIVFYPETGVSCVQKSQMATQDGDNTYVCAIRGNFDDAQSAVKKIFTDKQIIEKLAAKNKIFSSANSINVGRLVPQVVYYFYTYAKLCQTGKINQGDKVNFAVPTGNFGNILAGYYAQKLGLPVNKLICGSNENNVLYDFIKTGVYDKNRNFYKTISPSMDILLSSNLERLLYYVSGKDNSYVAGLMEELKLYGKYKVNDKIKSEIDELFFGSCSDEEMTQRTIRQVYEKYNYLIDTHTAVAYKAMEEYKNETGDNSVNIVMSTASPFKFSSSVYEAIYGLENSGNIDTDIYKDKLNADEFDIMEKLSIKTGVPVPSNLSGLRNKTVLHSSVCDISHMSEFVLNSI